MRVTVYNPLTASSYWRIGAVLTELRHDAVIGLPGRQKRGCGGRAALSAAQIQRSMVWCLRVKQECWCVVALLVSLVQIRTFATGMLPAPPVERTMRCRGGKKRSRTLLFHCSLLAPKPFGRGDATPWRKTLDAVYKWTDGLLMSLPTRCMSVCHAPKNHM